MGDSRQEEGMMYKLTACFCVLFLTGCAEDARLYQINVEPGKPAQVIHATYMSYGLGHGSISVTMPDGEVLKGEYDVVERGSSSFGSVYGSVYGPGGNASGMATGSALAIPNSSEGTAVLLGSRGTSMTCEFVTNNWTGKGNGACKSSSGGLYRAMF